jgi:hypothetical protein
MWLAGGEREQAASASISLCVLRIHRLYTSKGGMMKGLLNKYLTLTSAVQIQV